MIAACREEYPELEADIEQFRKNPGLVAYLLDTLVAMGPLEHLEENKQLSGEKECGPGSSDEDVELMARSEK